MLGGDLRDQIATREAVSTSPVHSAEKLVFGPTARAKSIASFHRTPPFCAVARAISGDRFP